MTESYNEGEMTMAGFTATAQTDVAATAQRVWAALTVPEEIATYMQGSQVATTWEIGSPIVWNGEYDDRSYQDKGEVLVYDEPHVLSMTHYSPMMGQPDEPANYHSLVYTLTASGDRTRLTLTQDGCDTEAQAAQFSHNWQQMLDGLRAHIEA